MTDQTHPSQSAEGTKTSEHRRKRRRSRSTGDPVVRTARKTRERWASRRHKVQSWLIILTAGMVILVGLNSLVEILTEKQFIPNLYTVLVAIALLGLLVWSFFRLVELVVERRYSSVSTKSKKNRKEQRKRRKERKASGQRSAGSRA